MPEAIDARADAVLQYWFDNEYTSWPKDKVAPEWRDRWFGKSDAADEEIKTKFSSTLEGFRDGTLDCWLEHPWTCFAGIIVMDQFNRNINRGNKEMYSLDDKSIQWAAHMATFPMYEELHPIMKLFVALPFMHGESLADQEQCMVMLRAALSTAALPGAHPLVALLSQCLEFGERHRVIVAKYGRFPHRNAILGRESTPEEAAGLADGSIEGF